jgi:uncharacterized cupredoxin-like copper-binding protein
MPTRITTNKPFVLSVLAFAVVAIAVVALLVRGQSADAKLSRSAHLKAASNGDLKFNTKKITVSHGKVTLTMTNPSSSGDTHAISIEGHGVDKDSKDADAGKTVSVSAKLKKGKYIFYCPIPGHRAAGMKGTLIVK